MPSKEFPTVSDELLKALDEQFPEKTPSPSDSDRDIWRAVGRREAVRFLARIREQQIENRNKKTIHVQQQRT